MTGMPASLACCSSGPAAWLSSAAKPIAVGALVERRLQHLDLLVDVGLGVGALEGDLDVELLGRLLGAGLHGLPELVLEALRDERDVRLVAVAAAASPPPPPSLAQPARTAAAATAARRSAPMVSAS